MNVTTNLQIILYLCFLLSGYVKHNRKFHCGNSLFLENMLMCYLHRTMSTWVQYDKYISAWIHRIRNKSTQAPGRPTLLTLHHPPNLEDSTNPTKKSCYSKNCTQSDSLPLNLINNIGICHADIVHRKIKPVLVQLTQHHPVLFSSTCYKLKYPPFEYCMH